MSTEQRKAFCVLRIEKCESFNIEPPTAQSIRRWHKTLQETGCLCKGKSSGRPRTSDENVEQIRQSFVRCPQKSVRQSSRELAIPPTTVWRVLRRRLRLKPYRIQLLQALHDDDMQKRNEFCTFVLEKSEEVEQFFYRIIFSDEATFHLNGKVNRHNVRIWRLEDPRVVVEHERNSPKLNVFCAVSRKKVYGPFFFDGNTITGNSYLQMIKDGLFQVLQADGNDFILQQDGVPSHCANDATFCPWPRSPDLTICDFFLWGYIKSIVYVPPLPKDIDEFKSRITDAINLVTVDMLQQVYEEFEYRLDVCRARFIFLILISVLITGIDFFDFVFGFGIDFGSSGDRKIKMNNYS
ncbi:hypothetical protein QTP88_009149 [Uroleucon formosanum]